ncbi:MAG: serine/threonine-protein kinase [Terriglobales bacterium]
MSEPINKRIGDYEIISELGAGGMGKVYKVRNVISDRIEAMKVLLPDLAGRQELAARFLREIKVLAALDHPNIAALRTALTLDNQLVMILEYVEGTTLTQRMQQGPVPVADAVNYISQVLDALSYAHQQHVIHRDVKPANMMLTPQGLVKLMDFGIARSGDDSTLTMTGTTLGSLGYMSPEQVKGEPTDARSDLYSVGISLYEMVTGRRPFRESSDYSIMAAQVNQPPTPPIEIKPGLPPALNEIILLAIAKDPGGRFQSADAFKNALSRVTPLPAAAHVDSARTVTSISSLPPTATMLPAQTVTASTVSARQPQATPAASQPGMAANVAPPTSASHRGLYMAVGGLIVLVALISAGMYSRNADARREASHAAAPAAQNAAAPAQPAQQAPPSVEAPADTSAQPAAEPPAPPPATPPVRAKAIATPQPDAAAQPAPDPNAPPPIDLDALEHDIDQLTARAGAVNSGLDGLRAQQARDGYGLRGDIAQRQESMKLNVQKAQDAISHGDGERAKRYSDLANADIEALEKFLGR